MAASSAVIRASVREGLLSGGDEIVPPESSMGWRCTPADAPQHRRMRRSGADGPRSGPIVDALPAELQDSAHGQWSPIQLVTPGLPETTSRIIPSESTCACCELSSSGGSRSRGDVPHAAELKALVRSSAAP